MDNVIWLIGGFLLGWVLEWLIDFFFWRRPGGQEQSQLIALEAAETRNRVLESEKRQLQSLVEDHAGVVSARDSLKAELDALQEQIQIGRRQSDDDAAA